MDRQEVIERIAALPDRSFRAVENTLRALEKMKENRYPFLGNFLNVVKEESTDPDVFVCSMPIVPEVLNPYRIVYGGVTATLADMAMGWMLEHRFEPGSKFVTIDMHVAYHHPGKGKKLTAEARLTHQARELLQVSCDIRGDQGELVSTSSATFLQLVRKESV
ncbi:MULTISPECIES: PaaI family thioesterase [Paenibacillus]|uniref:PaaI family thioesterase n=1 Tax=Paenibacillus TaxID=44249 RepID=UPI0022B8FDB1|nr:PaaI family thioesterase [Paenibacillus caseinilyticus]MCZ8521164.1 PaaI family thioesterase [Paenibacillus caseinilyticus]